MSEQQQVRAIERRTERGSAPGERGEGDERGSEVEFGESAETEAAMKRRRRTLAALVEREGASKAIHCVRESSRESGNECWRPRAPKCLFQAAFPGLPPLFHLIHRIYPYQASATRPATPASAAPAAFHDPAPSETAPLSDFESTAEFPLDELFDELASLSVDGTWPSAKLDPQYDEMAPKTDDSVEDDVPFDKADPSLVTSPWAQSVQTDEDGMDWSVLALREVRVEREICWPVADWTFWRSEVMQKVLFELYWRQMPSLTALKLATTARAVVCERDEVSQHIVSS